VASLSDVIDQMADFGITGISESDLIVDGTVKRFRPDEGRGKTAWYVLFEFVSEKGERFISGSFGDWRFGDKGQNIKVKGQSKLTNEEKKQFRDEQKRKQVLAKKKREEVARKAAQRAGTLWEKLKISGACSYLDRKQVHAYGLRFGNKDSVVVPLTDIKERILGLQVIYGSPKKGALDKEFWPKGCSLSGACFRIGGRPRSGEPIVVCEGYATGASIHQATGLCVFVAFNVGNLEPVASAVHKAFGKSPIVVAGDDDYLTTLPNGSVNPGKTKAEEVAHKVEGIAVVPTFMDRKHGVKWTDFNDLHVNESLDSVKKQIEWALSKIAATLPSTGEEEKTLNDDDLWSFNLKKIIDRFVLIYGTQTVFDDIIGCVMTLPSMRAAMGDELVKDWQTDPDRRVVKKENVLFDPSETCNVETTVNLFRGWPIKPVQGKCDLILELLEYLCASCMSNDGVDNREEVFDWIIKWCAYPLQHPGAKMRTAIIMHGGEGAGKNIFWSAIGAIYEKYYAIITQTELESQFNNWASGKMFVIGNEVVSRQEMYHQKGRIKNMITEPVWAINEKMLPLRMEQNHANFVFLSNAIQPGTPDKDDRRYLVVWTPPVLSQDFYKDASDQVDNGGVSALYHYLLNVELGDFNEHTKPPMTNAKQELIEASMDSHERFYREWVNKELQYPVIPCLTSQLYQAYVSWCKTKGERPARDAVFGSAISKQPDIERARKRFTVGSNTKQQRFYIPRNTLKDIAKSEPVWLGEKVSQFDECMRDMAA
jgi:putative DNA primase/helicase